jgi:hypothetical protein
VVLAESVLSSGTAEEREGRSNRDDGENEGAKVEEEAETEEEVDEVEAEDVGGGARSTKVEVGEWLV